MSRLSDKRFWDDRARESPFYFVDSRLDYGDPDLDGFWRGGEKGLDALLESTGMRVGERDTVVEIGCGVGRLTRAIAGRATRVLAVEVSPAMLDLARGHNAHLGNVEWLLGDGESLKDIDDGSVDGCVSLVVFQHIPDPEVVLSYVGEIGRVLRPGGWAAFHVSNDPQVHRMPLLARARMSVRARLRRAPRGQAHPAWLGTSVDLDELREVAERSGLRIETTVGEGTQYCLIGARRA